jgi:hypothetical protein
VSNFDFFLDQIKLQQEIEKREKIFKYYRIALSLLLIAFVVIIYNVFF